MTLQIKILNNMMGNWVKKYLPREGVWKWVTGPSGEGEAITVKDELLDPKELLDIINWRFSPGRKVQMTAVFGDPDFLPFSFLHKGIVCGSAVCRLVRWYGGCSETDATSDPNSQQEAALNRLIEEIKEQNDFRKRNGFNPFTQQELAEILLIDPDRVEAFFQGCETPLDALQPQKLKPLLPFVIGTGFLVGKNYLLTNHHVLENPDHLSEIRCQFGYERDLFGRLTLPVQYEIDLSFWMTNSALDYTLVRLKRHSSLGDAGDNFQYLRMMEDEKAIAPPLSIEEAEGLGIVSELQVEARERLYKPNLKGDKPGLPGEPVNIIQHPKGQPKEIILSSNRVQQIAKHFIRYEADADFSSSGSPVLNQQWQLVGLHHASLADENLNIVGQEGIRICRIVSDLVKKKERLEKAVTQIQGNAVKILRDITQYGDIIQKEIEGGYERPNARQTQKARKILHPRVFELIEVEWKRHLPKDGPIDIAAARKRIETAAMEIVKQCLQEVENTLQAIELRPLKEAISDNPDALEAKANEFQQKVSELEIFYKLYVEGVDRSRL